MLVGLLEDMLNPYEKDMVELDCIYQLKNLIKKYYHRKGQICEELIAKLDSMMIDRPS